MKLTKAQRLFIKAGEAQSLMKDFAERGFVNPTAKYRKLRKKFIREALWAYEEELIRAFYDGVSSVRKESDDSPMVIEEDGQNIII